MRPTTNLLPPYGVDPVPTPQSHSPTRREWRIDMREGGCLLTKILGNPSLPRRVFADLRNRPCVAPDDRVGVSEARRGKREEGESGLMFVRMNFTKTDPDSAEAARALY